MTTRRPADLDELLPAYALGAIDESEHDDLEAYLAEDPDAAAELSALRRTAARLRSPSGPRPEVWDRIAAQLTAEPSVVEEESRPAPAVVVPFERPHRRRVPLRVAAVAATLTLTTGVAAALTLRHDDPPPRTPVVTEAPVDADVAAAADAALTTPGAQRGTVDADGGASAAVVVLPSRRGYVLSVDGLRGKAYGLFAAMPAGAVLVATLTGEALPIAFVLPAGTLGLELVDLVSGVLPEAGPSGDSTTAPAPADGSTAPATTPDAPAVGGGETPVPAPPVTSPLTPPSPDGLITLPPLVGGLPSSLPPLIGLH